MDATCLSPDSPLPDDVPTLQALVRQLLTELSRLRADNADLRGKLDAALKHRFGRRSERQPSLLINKKVRARRIRSLTSSACRFLPPLEERWPKGVCPLGISRLTGVPGVQDLSIR